MRAVLLFLLFAGCASHEYSEMPDPQGEWAAANPPSVTQPPPAPVKPVWHRRWVRK